MNAQTRTRTTTPPWIIVAKREIMTHLSDKAFWIGTLSTLGLVALGLLFGGLFGGPGSAAKVAVATDEAAQVLVVANDMGLPVEEVRVAAGEEVASVEAGDAAAALTQSADKGWELTVKNVMDAPDLRPAVEEYQMGLNAAEQNVNISALRDGTDLALVVMDQDEGETMAIMIATMAFAVLFMMSAITYGMQIATSVVTEKESRIVEILAAAIPIRHLLIGKIVGNTALALAQVILIATVALVGLSFTEWSGFVGILAPVAGWFVLFFLVGFAALACFWAAAGAMATRVQDINQTTTPLIMIIMLVYMSGFFARGTLAQVLSYVPIASTVSMPGRLLSGESSWLDAVVALVIAVAFMALAVWFGSRVYRRGLLQTGTVMGWKDTLRKAA